MTTITVVICITRSARVLENGMPTVFVHQKYRITATANTAAISGAGSGKCGSPTASASWFNRLPR